MSDGGFRGNGRHDGRRLFSAPLLSYVVEAKQAGTCRVCHGSYELGDLIHIRAWHVESAHVACGYVKRGEEEPHECRRPGTFQTYWEWRCPSCGLDACSPRQPRDGDPRECERCAPRPPVEKDVVVEVISSTYVTAESVQRGRRKVGMVKIEPHTRAVVVKIGERDNALVHWLDCNAPDTWVARLLLTPLFRRAS